MLGLAAAAGIAALAIASPFDKAKPDSSATSGPDGSRGPTGALVVESEAAPGQAVTDLLQQSFAVTATCRQACDASTTVYLPLSDARRLGYEGEEPSTPGVEVASSWAELEAGVATDIALVLGEEGRALLASATSDVTLVGTVTAIDRDDPNVHGQVSWETVLSGHG